MMQTKMNQRVFFKLLNQFKTDFPGYELPDDGHVENSYKASGDDVYISEQLKNALLKNNPQYQQFEKNNPDLYKNPNNRGMAFNSFQGEFLGLNKPAPTGGLFGSTLPRFDNPSGLMGTSSMFGGRML